MVYQYKALKGDPDYTPYWNLVEGNKDDFAVPLIDEGLERLSKERVVLTVATGQLKDFFRRNPFHSHDLKVFAKSKAAFDVILFVQNSPVKAMFDLGLMWMRQSGSLDQLKKKWQGKDIVSSTGVKTMVLTSGQVTGLK